MRLGEPNPTVRWESAILIQGTYWPGLTNRVIKIFLERNEPNVLIVVSTFASSPEGQFLSEFEKDIVIKKEGPHVGRLIYLFMPRPHAVDLLKCIFTNQNLQRLSTLTALQFIQTLNVPLTLKIRSDAVLGKTNICKYLYDKFITLYPPMPHPEVKLEHAGIRGRIVVSDDTKRQRQQPRGDDIIEYFVYDHWLFGCTIDLIHYFDVAVADTASQDTESIETKLAKSWMRKVGIPESYDNLHDISARYLAVADSVDVEFVWNGTHNFDRYEQEGVAYLRDIHSSYAHEAWIRSVELIRRQDFRSSHSYSGATSIASFPCA